jgi:Superfamily II DNA/RNA helicases, SNF2 family
MPTSFAPGARVEIRDAEWVIRKAEMTPNGQALHVTGLSDPVKDRSAIFLSDLEDIRILRPEDTELVPDLSPAFRSSILFLESLLRRTPPTDERIHIGHRGAMNPAPYQLHPTVRALGQTRQRILIADAVGLGKTLEAGILVSELIRRGRGRRILVVTVKSMMTQFQKEFWSRFTIPLVRLDSAGIQRVYSRLPAGHEPLPTITTGPSSLWTPLKQDVQYRTFLEKAWWDIIIIDEAHNVAERGGGISQRARLARLLSERSDTLILLSATPHDGKARSFASLMNMLDPTAIADPSDYGPEDIKGLFIRRFKKDIQNQAAGAFRDRKILTLECRASREEEDAFSCLAGLDLSRKADRSTGDLLFRIVLEKALFSSPAACLQTLRKRLQKLRKEGEPETTADIGALSALEEKVAAVTPDHLGRYRTLLETLRSHPELAWNGSDPGDRLVIFSERLETLHWLKRNLLDDLGLPENAVAVLHGGMSDTEQQRLVEDFGKKSVPVRLLLASDVASEGINLHYLCHRLVHFDIPWSLMTFQQRNGRIDRYGQIQTPLIAYLVTKSENERILGDLRFSSFSSRKMKRPSKYR